MRYQQPHGTAADSPYVNGNPSTGTQGSIPPAESIEHPQRELVDLITKEGLLPASTDLGQLAKGIQLGKITYGIDSGTANAIDIALSPTPTAYQAGMAIKIKKAAFANSTAAVTLNVNGLGPKQVKTRAGLFLAPGDLPASSVFLVMYDGIDFRLLAMVPSEMSTIGAKYSFANGYQLYATPGVYTWTVPADVTRCYVIIWGGGGSGGGHGGGNGHGGSGGGGGGYAERLITNLVPGTGITVTVGAGGVAVTGSATGLPGGTSSFGAYASATGGVGGNYGSTGTYQASTGTIGQVVNNTANGSGGNINLPGNRGQQGGICWITNVWSIGGPGGAAAGPGGAGGPPTTSGGNVGTAPGGGGAGAGGGTASSATSGSGAAGMVIVTWVDPNLP